MNGKNGKQSDYPEIALVPYPVIVAASKGDPDAMKIVLQHFSGYISCVFFMIQQPVFRKSVTYVLKMSVLIILQVSRSLVKAEKPG